MRLFFGAPGWRALVAGGGVVALGLLLSACGSANRGGGQSGWGNFASVLMGPAGTGESNLQGERPEPPGGPTCPGIVVRSGTETLRRYERGFEGDPQRLIYQGSITETARECTFSGDRAVSIKFGVAGRLITGPAGQPGKYELPVRAVFTRVGTEPAWTQLYRVPVTVLPGESNARFTYVEQNLSYELPEGESFGYYVIYVGFDEMSR